MWFVRNPKVLNSAYTLCRLILGAVFLYACWEKILDPAAFSRIIDNYQIVSTDTGKLVALFLPWLELVCGVGLIINRWPRGSALIVMVLMLVFMAALGYNIYRGIDVNCGCFTLGNDAPGSMWFYLIRDILLLAMAVGVLFYRYPGQKTSTPI